MFGSKKRQREKLKAAGYMKEMAEDTQSQLDALKAENPFESASSKLALKTASRNAKQMQNRFLNTMGTGATPEAMIAAQQAGQEALGAATGQIAAGAEATKAAQEAQLRAEKSSQMGQYVGTRVGAADEIGSGWGTLFQGISALGDVASGLGAAGLKL